MIFQEVTAKKEKRKQSRKEFKACLFISYVALGAFMNFLVLTVILFQNEYISNT